MMSRRKSRKSKKMHLLKIDLHKEIDSMQENMNMTYENNTTPKRKKHNILITLLLSLALSINDLSKT